MKNLIIMVLIAGMVVAAGMVGNFGKAAIEFKINQINTINRSL